MTNWFASIGQATTGLNAARYGLSIVSQNIENADTDGYSRQSVQQASIDSTIAVGLYTTKLGPTNQSGVTVLGVSRADDPVLDARVRNEHAKGASTDATASTLSDIEQLLPEPGTNGLSSQLDTFYKDWGTVANAPDNTAARTVLLKDAASAASTLTSLSASLSDVATGTAGALSGDVTQANTAATQLASLNQQIAIASATGQNGNALLDQRDQLLNQLSTLVGGTATIAANGQASVTVGGQALVDGITANSMSVDSSSQVSVNGTAVTLSGGSAGARVTALTSTIPGYQAQLDSVANSLISAGNSIQSSGYDLAGNAGTPLFGGSGASDIAVVLTNPNGIAASSSPGGNLDGSNALAASQQGSATGSPSKLYTSLIGDVAGASASAQQLQTTQSAVVSNVDGLKSSVSGVNYDEEVSNMLTYQHAFSASSRVLTTIDQMLDTLINHTGVVGLS